MRGQDVREVFTKILPDEALQEVVAAAGFQTRERKLDALRFLRAMVISASTGSCGRQAMVAQMYFEAGDVKPPKVVRGGFYAWFGPPLEKVMERVRDLAFEYGRKQRLDLPGVLGRAVSDWHIVDSTTVQLNKQLKEEYPGTGDYAALKIHKRYSVGLGTLVGYEIGPAREHDNKRLRIDESWRGLGLLADLGYASFQLLRDCSEHEVKYVIRLKENWKPKVMEVARGSLTRAFFAGTDLDVLLEEEALKLGRKPLDLDVELGSGTGRISARMVGVPTPKGYCFFLTNLSRRTHSAEEVAALYRVRWEIELDNKLDKSCLHLDEIGARKGPAVRAMVHAAMVASMIVCLIAHHHRLQEAPPKAAGTERKKPPIHPQALARTVGAWSSSIALAMQLSGEKADKTWQDIAEGLLHLGTDPNWRTSPSVLDQLRGWRISPGRPRKAKTQPRAAVI